MEQVLSMGNIYVGMSTAIGVLLFFLILAIISNICKSIKKKILPDHNSSTIIKMFTDQLELNKNNQQTNIAWPVLLETAGGTVKAETRDLNKSGAFIKCTNPLGLQEQFRMKIIIPDQDPVNLNAEVIWSNGSIPEERIVTRGMKIRFIKNLEKDRDILNSTLRMHIESTSNAAPRLRPLENIRI